MQSVVLGRATRACVIHITGITCEGAGVMITQLSALYSLTLFIFVFTAHLLRPKYFYYLRNFAITSCDFRAAFEYGCNTEY